MKIEENIFWVFYIGDTSKLLKDKVGKWMYFFEDRNIVEKICKECVEKEIVCEAKHSNAGDGVACFYMNIDDTESHKRILEYFIKNNMIPKTKKRSILQYFFQIRLSN